MKSEKNKEETLILYTRSLPSTYGRKEQHMVIAGSPRFRSLSSVTSGDILWCGEIHRSDYGHLRGQAARHRLRAYRVFLDMLQDLTLDGFTAPPSYTKRGLAPAEPVNLTELATSIRLIESQLEGGDS